MVAKAEKYTRWCKVKS